MTKRRPPVIGITCSDIGTEPDQRPPRLGQNQTYLNALIRAGAAPVLIPHLTAGALLDTVYEGIDGLLLPGGVDVDPAQYGQARHEKCGETSPARDETELTLARRAMADGKPLLAICRGIQVLNVALGGSLYQDIQAQVPGALKHDWYPGYPRDHRPHAVRLAAGTHLARLLGTTSLPVNSLHHQALRETAPGLVAVGHAPDGIVEAAEAPDHPFALAVQWHPEELAASDPRARALFDALVQASQT